MVVVLMGVTGSGKTTVGERLASELGWTFADADDFHPAANKAKMHAGIPLTDEDRWPWLQALRRVVEQALESHRGEIIACSALKTPIATRSPAACRTYASLCWTATRTCSGRGLRAVSTSS